MRKFSDTRFRIVMFSSAKSELKQVEFSVRRLVFLLTISGLLLGLLFSGGFFAFTKFFPAMSISAVDDLAAASSLSSDIDKLEKRFASLSGTLDEWDKTDAAGESLIDENSDVFLSYSDLDSLAMKAEIQAMIDNLEMRAQETMRIQETFKETFGEDNGKLKSHPSIKPLQGGRVSDLFGKRRDPFLRRTRHHGGVDIAAPRGTEVYAPADGIVVYVQQKYTLNRGYGRFVRIDHGNGIVTLYGHLQKVTVKRGQKVKRWDIIGLVGDTGRATGPHLHYEVRENGKRIDPMAYILNN